MKSNRSLVSIFAVLLLCGLPLLYAASAVNVTWQMLRTLDYRTGKRGPAVQQIDGKEVKIPGFMVPLEDDSDEVTEFLLVPYAGACIHVPPPPPNQIVHVTMTGHKKVKVTFTDPIWVTGALRVSTVKSPYGDVSYDLSGQSIEAYPEQ